MIPTIASRIGSVSCPDEFPFLSFLVEIALGRLRVFSASLVSLPSFLVSPVSFLSLVMHDSGVCLFVLLTLGPAAASFRLVWFCT
ncbi:hypothetical protein IWZ01DRAFT_122566 [Phyllosticta capitalensis]